MNYFSFYHVKLIAVVNKKLFGCIIDIVGESVLIEKFRPMKILYDLFLVHVQR